MSTASLVLVGENRIGGILTLSEISADKTEIVLYGNNSINGHSIPKGIHDIPEGTSTIVINGVSIEFKDKDGNSLRIFTF